MHKVRLYIIQALGILLLLTGYFLSDRPDSESVMHFNLRGNVISTPTDDGCTYDRSATFLAERNHLHKFRIAKYFSFKVVLPAPSIVYHYVPTVEINYTEPVNESYYFLFCKEINPPPPKAC